MNDFEFLRVIGIGQFVPVESPFRRLDGRARLLVILLVLGGVLFTTNHLGIWVGLALIIAGYLASRLPLKLGLSGLLPPLPFILILAAIQVVYNPYPKIPPLLFHWWMISIYPVDVWAGALMLLRFCGLLLGITLVTLTFSTSEMIHSLEGLLSPLAWVKVPVQDFAMIVQVTLRFLPSLAQTAERVAKAQAARGGDWGAGRGSLLSRARQIVPMIVPLFVISLHRGERMALAMDSRGYGGPVKRTSMVVMKMRWVDYLAVLIAAMMALITLFVR